jgi:hypothetical protein
VKKRKKKMIGAAAQNATGRPVNPWLSLAQGIVYQAILDWKRLDDGATVRNTNYTTLRNFFRSAWCESLLLFTDISPELILEKLEKETKGEQA